MRYQMEDGTVVDTDKATATWPEGSRWDGNNFVSTATGSQWEHETLYRSRSGSYYIVSASNWQGTAPTATWCSDEDACRWLLVAEAELPADLAALADSICD